MLSYVSRQIIKKNRKETRHDQEVQRRKTAGVIEARKAGLTIAQIAAQTRVGQTTIKIWLKDADCRIIGI